MQLENPQVDEPAIAATDDVTDPPEGEEGAPPAADPAPAAPKPGDSTADPKDTAQRRINEITRKRREAERRADARDRENETLRRELEQLRQGSRGGRDADPEHDSAPQLKTLADFEFDEGKFRTYLREVDREDNRKVMREELKAEREREAAQNRHSMFKQRERDFAKENPDYEDVVYDRANTFFTDAISQVIQHSEQGPAIAFYLSNNRDIAKNIAQMQPYEAAYEIARIEATLTAERKKPPERMISKAPSPVPKIDGSADAALPKSIDDPSLSDEEFAKMRRKQLKAKGKGFSP